MPNPFGNAFPTAFTEIGIATEVTKGTAVNPAYWVPVRSPKYKPDQMILPDETLQGSMVLVYDLVRGMRYDAHGWDSYPYLDSFPVLCRAQLGSPDNLTAAPANTTLSAPAVAGATSITVGSSISTGQWFVIGTGGSQETHYATTTGTTITLNYPLAFAQPSGAAVTGLTAHAFSTLNNANEGQPPALTITDYDGEEWRQLTACQMDELTIKGNATGLVEYTASFLGNPAVENSGGQTPSFSGVQTVEPWSVTPNIGGAVTPTVTEWEFNFKRGTKPIPALTGSTEYFEYFAGPVQCAGKMTFVETSGSPELNAYLNGTPQVLDFTIFDGVTGYALNIHSSKMRFITGEIDRTKEWVEVPTTMQFLPTTTDALAGGVSPYKLTVANAQTASF